MAKDKTNTTEQAISDNPLYSDIEVSGIIGDLGILYSLDDAIYNQQQLRRPETFIKPLEHVRNSISERLRVNTSKADPSAPKKESSETPPS
jgi:hypothetical protein